ncbi:plasmid pRiA4b ORF-3 family protein [Alkalihalobacterium bogoriense]|uniref:plasmid pRiA4b ORF-3 family protein n=1 Tax=Alkalihalobacterium bogoriense TaxID=246272 RepID=UPI00047B1C34|nr:hypothetical protein [Alkalihalobacterium bogoriense]
MLIHCATKLLSQLKEPEEQVIVEEEHPLFTWRATLVKIERRNTIILVNESNHYVIVLYGVKAKQLNSFNNTITDAIQKAFFEENIRKEVIEAYFSKTKNIQLAPIHDEKEDIMLTNACHYAKAQFGDRQMIAPSIHQTEITQAVNQYGVEHEDGEFIYPNEELYADLEELVEHSIFNQEAVTLQLTMQKGQAAISRTVVVPEKMTLRTLHKVIQILFSWENFYKHEFKRKSSDGNEESVVSGVDEEREVRLSDCLVGGDMLYHYYADKTTWKVHITVENWIDDYDVNYPTCTGGKGGSPMDCSIELLLDPRGKVRRFNITSVNEQLIELAL